MLPTIIADMATQIAEVANRAEIQFLENIIFKNIRWTVSTACSRCGDRYGAFMIHYDNYRQSIRLCKQCKSEWERDLGAG